MKIMHVTTAVVWALALLLLPPLEANAGGRGGGVRVGDHHFVRGHHVVNGRHVLARQHFRSFRNQNSGLWPWYGGNGDYDPYTYDNSLTYETPQTVVVRPEPPPCQHSEQTRKVPSANGGTTEVTILRC
jgi:hypothetical protein